MTSPVPSPRKEESFLKLKIRLFALSKFEDPFPPRVSSSRNDNRRRTIMPNSLGFNLFMCHIGQERALTRQAGGSGEGRPTCNMLTINSTIMHSRELKHDFQPCKLGGIRHYCDFPSAVLLSPSVKLAFYFT